MSSDKKIIEAIFSFIDSLPTNDPLRKEMESYLKKLENRLLGRFRETIITGFATNDRFDEHKLTTNMAKSKSFKVISADTKEEYFVRCVKKAGSAYRAEVRIEEGKNVFFKMTLVCDTNSSIYAKPGW